MRNVIVRQYREGKCAVYVDGVLTPMTDLEKDILSILVIMPSWVSINEIIDFLWGMRPDGGPLYASQTIVYYIHRLRSFGIKIESAYTFGYRIT